MHIPPGLVQNLPTDKIWIYKTNDISNTDSVAELNYSAWNDACTGDYQNTLGNIQNPPTCKIWNDDTDHDSDADSAHPHDSPGTGKPDPLIGWPIRMVRPEWGRQDCRRIS